MSSETRFAALVEARPELRPLALLVYVVSAAGVLGVSFVSPVLPVMMDALALTGAQSGLVVAAYTAPVVAFVPVFGWLSDRVGRRAVIAAGLVLFGGAGSLVFVAPDFRAVLGLRVLQGVGFSAMMPLTTAVLGDLFRDEVELGAQGLRITFVSLGAAVYPVLGGVLAGVSWRLPFLLFAVTVPLGLLVAVALPPGTDSGASTSSGSGYLRDVVAGVRDPFVAGALATGFGRFFVRYGLWTYLPLLATRRALDPGQVGLVVGAVGAAKMVAAARSRRVLSLGPSPVVMAVGLSVGSLTVAAVTLASSLPAFVLVGAAFGAIDGSIAPLQKSLVTQRAGEDVRGGLVSVNNVLQNAGKTLGPAVLGVLVGALALPTLFWVLGVAGGAIGALVLASALRIRAAGGGDPLAGLGD